VVVLSPPRKRRRRARVTIFVTSAAAIRQVSGSRDVAPERQPDGVSTVLRSERGVAHALHSASAKTATV
jgi:hypothetical protein